MEHLNILATTNVLTNVAYGRPFTSVEEVGEHILNQLVHGVAIFYFLKKDGTTRKAIGTLSPSLIPGLSANDQKRLQVMLSVTFHALVAERRKHEGEYTTDDDKKRANVYNDVAAEVAAAVSNIDEDDADSRSQRAKSPDTQIFYDLEKLRWSSYQKANVLAIMLLNEKGAE